MLGSVKVADLLVMGFDNAATYSMSVGALTSRVGVPWPFCTGGFVAPFITGGSVGVLSVPLRVCGRGPFGLFTYGCTHTAMGQRCCSSCQSLLRLTEHETGSMSQECTLPWDRDWSEPVVAWSLALLIHWPNSLWRSSISWS